jgi:hypothetical protein
MAVVAGVRLAAIWWRLQLPVFSVDDAERAASDADRRA